MMRLMQLVKFVQTIDFFQKQVDIFLYLEYTISTKREISSW